ncbi:MAG: BNR-4 repeat-containing protein, partial [Tepidisphaeraceae bacterium]
GYGTFQSHNQKVLSCSGGIFMTHLRTRNEAYTAQQWRFSRSADGGRTFTTLHEATHATHPPSIETDEHDNVYFFRSDLTTGDAYLHAFLAANDYREPRVTPIPGGAAQKFGAYYDAARKQLYYASYNRFDVIGVDGKVGRSSKLFQPGKKAEYQYPHLSLDAAGVLHFAWTSVPFGQFTYRSIHFMHSPDGGVTWCNADGTALTPPIVADDTGPATRVNLDDELDGSSWLSNFRVRDGKGHFLYMSCAAPRRQHYVRYDLKTGKRELDVTPKFKGESIELWGLDGFFAASEKTLYCVGHTPDGRVGCLASDDNGATWRDHAVSDKLEGLYAVGGCRDVSVDGLVIGSFTSTTNPGGVSKVYFFRIPTAHP